MAQDLTICTVSYDSGPYIELNLALTERLNPGEQPRWLVCENSPAGSAYRFSSSRQDAVSIIEGPPAQDYGKATGSYHHVAFQLGMKAFITRCKRVWRL